MQVPPVGLDAFRADSSKLPVPPKPFFRPSVKVWKKKKVLGCSKKFMAQIGTFLVEARKGATCLPIFIGEVAADLGRFVSNLCRPGSGFS